MEYSPSAKTERPRDQEPGIRWYVRLGAMITGALAGAIPGTVMICVCLGFVGVNVAYFWTLFLICSGIGALLGILFPRATIDYGKAFLAAFGI